MFPSTSETSHSEQPLRRGPRRRSGISDDSRTPRSPLLGVAESSWRVAGRRLMAILLASAIFPPAALSSVAQPRDFPSLLGRVL